MKMKKICIFGGGSLYRLPVYKLMSERIGCDFYVVEDDPSMGIKTYDYNLLPTYKGSLRQKKLFGNFFWLKGAVSLYWKDYDIYVLGGPFCLSYWLLIILSWFSKKKVTTWSHGMYGRETGIRRVIKVLFYKLCSMNFVYNDRAKELMIQDGVKKDRICPVYNSMDTDHDLKIRQQLSSKDIYADYFKNNNPVIIFVGRVIKDKKLDLLIKAMLILKEKGHPVNFFVVGKDVDGVNLAHIAKDLGVSDSVYLYGPCYDEVILGDFYYNADLCVSPGAIGLTAISAMSFGCPVITHNDLSHQGPEFESVISGVTGDFFKADSVEDLASVIIRWFDTMTPSKKEEIRKNTMREIDTKWNIYSEVAAFEKTFQKI